MLLLVSIACLFYDSAAAVIILLPFLAYYLWVWREQCIKKKKEEFRMQFKESMTAMSSALNIGYSVENSIKEVLKDLKPLYRPESRIICEYTYMVHQLNMNVPSEVVLREFADRVDQEDVENFVTVFVTAKKAGGDSVAIIRNTVKIICDKIDVKREIQTMMAAKQFEFKVMTAVPLGIIGYMRLSFAEFMSALYGNVIGVTVMTVCLLLYAVAYFMGKIIVDIEI